MATELKDDTFIAANPLGVGRTVPGRCVAVALGFIGQGITVAEYHKQMAKWVEKHPQPHMAFPGGSNANALLRFLVDRNKKVVVIEGKRKAKKAAAEPKTKVKAKKATPKKAKKVVTSVEQPPAE